ncbi:hypothetical protein NFHSH190041_18070 [Shewanella sp. NFH-SH190041]|uniref:hypothetical protein n=1 Tax=Shewanella sp. NFH-SH190041 TaxID=2950245 RepID=UPI0021C48568|nr:hypothetical protein [Shewanella sp. NFH-SH190041]BDM64355.1 hypothetical protein NFHSH190041_18070 [Shewanella sp. NFH-SH190041]
MKFKALLTIVAALLASACLFHFKASLGLLVLPLFMLLVVFVTLRLYMLMAQDDISGN